MKASEKCLAIILMAKQSDFITTRQKEPSTTIGEEKATRQQHCIKEVEMKKEIIEKLKEIKFRSMDCCHKYAIEVIELIDVMIIEIEDEYREE
jgi:hypothetical protein